MGSRKLIFSMLLCLAVGSSMAQDDRRFAAADSTSYVLYSTGKWKELRAFGKKALASGTDFPYLQMRTGYAAFMLGNYSEALAHYEKALESDSDNQTARYYAYLCNKYLNRTLAASYHAQFLDDETRQKEKLTKYAASCFGIETSFKFTDYAPRENANYTRVGFSNRLGWRLQADQSVAYFGQQVTLQPTVAGPGPGPRIASIYQNSQFEYYGRLSYALSTKLMAWGAYHFLSTTYINVSYGSHVGLLGLKYAAPYFDLQADANIGTLTGTQIKQYNGRLGIYPFGNLNLYSFTRLSLQDVPGVQRTILNQTIGFKPVDKIWLEGSASFGEIDNFLEADGLYVFNAIDLSKRKNGGTLYYQLSPKATFQLNYTHEKKYDNQQSLNYNQHSLTGGISWKF